MLYIFALRPIAVNMAPKSWATEEQLVFLNANKTDFWKYSEQGRQSKFWPLIRGKWFDIWPEVKALIEAKILPEEAANHDKLGPDGVPLYKMMETEAQLYGASITKREKVPIRTSCFTVSNAFSI